MNQSATLESLYWNNAWSFANFVQPHSASFIRCYLAEKK